MVAYQEKIERYSSFLDGKLANSIKGAIQHYFWIICWRHLEIWTNKWK